MLFCCFTFEKSGESAGTGVLLSISGRGGGGGGAGAMCGEGGGVGTCLDTRLNTTTGLTQAVQKVASLKTVQNTTNVGNSFSCHIFNNWNE